jgi:hypothetical protein
MLANLFHLPSLQPWLKIDNHEVRLVVCCICSCFMLVMFAVFEGCTLADLFHLPSLQPWLKIDNHEVRLVAVGCALPLLLYYLVLLVACGVCTLTDLLHVPSLQPWLKIENHEVRWWRLVTVVRCRCRCSMLVLLAVFGVYADRLFHLHLPSLHPLLKLSIIRV